MQRPAGDWPNAQSSRFVEAAGLLWHVQTMGQGPCLLLVHGTGASTHSWRDLMPILAASYSVMAFDLPGHGFTSAAPRGGGSIGGMSGSIAALLAELRFEPRFCVGHSAGAVILCRMALDRKIRPRLIVGINGAFLAFAGSGGWFFSALAKFLARGPGLPQLLAWRASNRANVVRVIEGTGSKLDAAGLDLYSRLVRDPKHLAGALDMMSSWDLQAFARDLPALDIPLALLATAGDRTVPASQAAEVARLVPHASVLVLPALGHLAHEEQPSLIAREILRLCSDVGAA